MHRIEILETRIAPAGATYHYTDIDGDKVTITTSLGVDADLANAAHVVGGQLQLLNLRNDTFGAEFAHSDITFSVVKAAGGDGLAHVGFIDATGTDLGKMTIHGDLGRIAAGNNNILEPTIGALTVESFGRYGIDTQAAGGNLTSTINGPVGALTVKGDVSGAFIDVIGGDGSIGAITIGGSLIGGSAMNSGEIYSTGNIGALKIGHDVQGGAGKFSGFITSFTGNIASVTVGGSVIGDGNTVSGVITSTGDMGAVSIGRDVKGGSGDNSGMIQSGGTMGTVTLGGSLLGGTALTANNTNSGVIESAGDMGAVKIGRNVQGGTAASVSGAIKSDNGKIASVSIAGSFLGGDGAGAGEIIAQLDLGAVTIGHEMIGSNGASSALIASNAGGIASLAIGGSLVGGSNMGSGEITCASDIGAIKIGHNLRGGGGAQSGFIRSTAGSIGTLTIGGSVIGGTVGDSGEVIAHSDLGAVKIGHDLQGGGGSQSGTVQSELTTIASVTIGGSLIGGSAGSGSGEIIAKGDLGAVKIGHDIQGGAGVISGIVQSKTGKIASLSIGGSLIGGSGLSSGEVFCSGDLGPVTIKHDMQGGTNDGAALLRSINGKIISIAIGGSLVGGTGAESGEIASHLDLGAVKIGHDLRGGTMDKAGRINVEAGKLASISIGGSLIGGAGTNTGAIFSTGDIGAVKIGHNLQGGAGVVSAFIQSSAGKIASLTIGGSLIGGSNTNTGQVICQGDLGAVKIGHDLQGGAGSLSGFIQSQSGGIASISIGGSLVGAGVAANINNAEIIANGDLGPVKIGHDVRGSAAAESGAIKSDAGKVASVSIGGSLIGGAGASSGELVANTDIGPVKIGHDLRGGSATRAGFINTTLGKIASVTIGGSLIGGTDGATGDISAQTDLGPVKIGHDVIGGTGSTSGHLEAYKGNLASVTIGGSLTGTGALDSGTIFSAFGNIGPVKIAHDLNGGAISTHMGTIGAVTIGGSLIGGAAGETGNITAAMGLGFVKIGHDLVGGDGDSSGAIFGANIPGVAIGGSILGGFGNRSGTLFNFGTFGAVTVGGDIIGGSITGSASLAFSGGIFGFGPTKSISIGGSIIAGFNNSSGTLVDSGFIATAALGSLTVGGSLVGNATGATVNIVSVGDVSVAAFGTINIGGRVERAEIRAGYFVDFANAGAFVTVNGDAQIGAVKVGGDWIASDLVAGATDGGNGFGNNNDAAIPKSMNTQNDPLVFSKIASIVIGGQVAGTSSAISGSDHFGFVAEQIGSFKAGLFIAPLTPVKDAPSEISLPTHDVTIREI